MSGVSEQWEMIENPFGVHLHHVGHILIVVASGPTFAVNDDRAN